MMDGWLAQPAGQREAQAVESRANSTSNCWSLSLSHSLTTILPNSRFYLSELFFLFICSHTHSLPHLPRHHNRHLQTLIPTNISVFTCARLALGLTRHRCFTRRLPARFPAVRLPCQQQSRQEVHSISKAHVRQPHSPQPRIPWPFISKMSSSDDDQPLVKGTSRAVSLPPARAVTQFAGPAQQAESLF